MRLRRAALRGLVIACAITWGHVRAAQLVDGTAVHVRLTADLLSSHAAVGNRVDLEIASPVTLQGLVAIPVGSTVWGAVQAVKSGKLLHFDIEGVRLPHQEIVKLRCSPQKTNRAARDEIKVETQVAGDLGAAKGSEFTAYLDQDVNIDLTGAPAAPAKPAPAVAPSPAPAAATPVAKPAPAVIAPLPPPTPPVKPAPAAQVHSPAAPAAVAPTVPVPAVPAPPAPVAHPAPAAQPGEYVTIQCFSDPLGADILIDDEFHGSTPSILKLPPGNHRIEYRLMGYKAQSQPLNLAPGMPVQTVQLPLLKQP